MAVLTALALWPAAALEFTHHALAHLRAALTQPKETHPA